MIPINFKGSNIIFGEDQPQYIRLPAYIDQAGQVTSLWKPTFKERIQILFGHNIALLLSTFNEPIQPQQIFITNYKEIKDESCKQK